MIGHLVTFGIGVVFALGFGLAGLTDPATIVSFLHVTGDWNPSILLVMGTAVAVTGIGYRLTFRHRSAPVLAPRFGVPTRRDIDGRLVAGAAIFGFGWGFVGLCPGPAFASVASGNGPVLVFLVAMFGGMALFTMWEKARARAERARAARPDGAVPPHAAPLESR